eukprot:scaffold86807_cov70-Cyclotella_meneghiniana.AAC.4
MLETHCRDYGRHDRESVPAPDVIMLFNPGFFCPDYDWSAALDEAISLSHVGAIPFLVTTNTEMEGFADTKYLLDGNYIDSKSIPGDILKTVDFPGIKRDFVTLMTRMNRFPLIWIESSILWTGLDE